MKGSAVRIRSSALDGIRLPGRDEMPTAASAGESTVGAPDLHEPLRDTPRRTPQAPRQSPSWV